MAGINDFEFCGPLTVGEDDERIVCGATDCAFGTYAREDSPQHRTNSPGCSRCGVVSVSLTEVFGPDVESIVPECYMVAAATYLIRREEDLAPLSILRHQSKETLVKIARYSRSSSIN